jgi:leader peptidase (prepilin peptidase)/N-methyltransferase
MELILIIILGGIIGSFISMLSYRIPFKDHSIFSKKHSFCPKCKHILEWKSLIPVLSYLYQNGKCSYCKSKIPIRYLLIELATILIFTMIYLTFGLNYNSAILLVLATLLMTIIITDLEHYIIPDSIQILLLVNALTYVIYNDFSLLHSLLSGILYLSIGLALRYSFLKIMHKEALGFGDIKFMGIAGIFLGYNEISIFLLLSGLIGTAFGLIWTKLTKNKTFPFGPALAIALLLCLLGLNTNTIISWIF